MRRGRSTSEHVSTVAVNQSRRIGPVVPLHLRTAGAERRRVAFAHLVVLASGAEDRRRQRRRRATCDASEERPREATCRVAAALER